MPPKLQEKQAIPVQALVLGGGVLTDYAMVRQCLANRRFSLVVCADSGLHHADPLGVTPTHVVGDFDSVGPGWEMLAGSAVVQRYSADKDKTDLQLAVELAIACGANELVIVGATGGRLDHLLGNVLLLPGLSDRGVAARLLDDWGEAWIAPPVCRFDASPGQTVSLLPLTPAVTGVAVRGLRYELDDATVTWGATVSISNEGTGGAAEVRHASGTLLIVRGHEGAPPKGVAGP